MFTGIIKDIGTIKSVEEKADGVYFVIESKLAAGFDEAGIAEGASIAVDGVCQTVLSYDENSFEIQAMPETLNVTNFKSLKEGSRVNLEPALKLNDAIDGHLVQGHVDCTGEVLNVVGMEGSDGVEAGTGIGTTDGVRLQIQFPPSIDEFIVYKGSITVNGVSLTISKVGVLDKEEVEDGASDDDADDGLGVSYFEVALIEHTLENTNLSSLKKGDKVNLEIDMMARYASKMLGRK